MVLLPLAVGRRATFMTKRKWRVSPEQSRHRFFEPIMADQCLTLDCKQRVEVLKYGGTAGRATFSQHIFSQLAPYSSVFRKPRLPETLDDLRSGCHLASGSE